MRITTETILGIIPTDPEVSKMKKFKHIAVFTLLLVGVGAYLFNTANLFGVLNSSPCSVPSEVTTHTKKQVTYSDAEIAKATQLSDRQTAQADADASTTSASDRAMSLGSMPESGVARKASQQQMNSRLGESYLAFDDAVTYAFSSTDPEQAIEEIGYEMTHNPIFFHMFCQWAEQTVLPNGKTIADYNERFKDFLNRTAEAMEQPYSNLERGWNIWTEQIGTNICVTEEYLSYANCGVAFIKDCTIGALESRPSATNWSRGLQADAEEVITEISGYTENLPAFIVSKVVKNGDKLFEFGFNAYDKRIEIFDTPKPETPTETPNTPPSTPSTPTTPNNPTPNKPTPKPTPTPTPTPTPSKPTPSKPTPPTPKPEKPTPNKPTPPTPSNPTSNKNASKDSCNQGNANTGSRPNNPTNGAGESQQGKNDTPQRKIIPPVPSYGGNNSGSSGSSHSNSTTPSHQGSDNHSAPSTAPIKPNNSQYNGGSAGSNSGAFILED